MYRRAGYAAIVLVVAVFTVAMIYSGVRLTQQYGTAFNFLRTGNWIAAQTNFEYLRLGHAITSFQLAPTPESKQAMLTRLELFWSRLPLVMEGDESNHIRSLPGVSEPVQRVLDDLPNLERQLTALDGTSDLAYREAMAHLETYRPAFQSLMQAMLMGAASIAADRVRYEHYKTLAAFVIVMLAGTCLIALLTRSLRAARAAETEASQARDLLEDAIEGIDEGFVFYDRDERLVIANSKYKNFYPMIAELVRPGIRLEQLLRASAERGQYDTGLTPEEWTARRLEQHRRPTGPVTQLLVDGRILRINDTRTRGGGIVSVRADVTELVQAEELLKKRLAAIEAAPDGIAIVAPDGRLQYANESFCGLFDRSAKALAGADWVELFAPDERENLRLQMAGEEGAARGWRGKSIGLRADGSQVPVNTGFARLEDDGLVLIVRDMTLDLKADQKRADLERQLNQAQKLEAIGRLAGGIAHDFNNFLTAISGYASFLVDDLPAGSQQRGFAENVVTAAQRAKELVQQILAFSRSEEVERQLVDPALVVEGTVRMLRSMVPPATRLTVVRSATGQLVSANATQLGQVLMNLCLNAHDALEGRNGSIRITLDGPTPPPAHPHAPALVVDDGPPGTIGMSVGEPAPDTRYVRITVRDDGSGMAIDIMERIFDPFFTTKEIGKGTGLGLAAVHGIMMAHQGLIEVVSHPGAGTEFRLYLPAREGTLPTASPAATTAPVPKGNGRVLVVDDQEAVATMTATALERMGYEPTVCISSEEAIEALNEDADAWDIVLSDYLMPGANGLDLARHVRRLRADMPIVLYTGFSDNLSEAQARSFGVAALLQKPLDNAKLCMTLQAALDGAARAAPAA